MKKLFTLSIAIVFVGALNAQMTESGNGFAENFDYADGTVYADVAYDGIGAEWPDGSVIEGGKLKWELAEAEEGAIGLWELSMDLTGNTDITFKYQFPAGGEFGIWIEDTDGGGGELFPEDFLLGLSEMQDYTFDASAVEGVDLSIVAEIWIMSANAGTFYLDDLVIGDGTFVGIPKKVVQNTLNLYPNPAGDELKIDADIESISIYNALGQEVFSMENYRKGSSIDISELQQGLYIINADEKVQKLMVE